MDNYADHNPSNLSSIAADAAYLSETAIFPCAIRYLIMVNIFNKRENKVSEGRHLYSQELVGTVIILDLALLINGLLCSGKTCMLYYILILCIIRAQYCFKTYPDKFCLLMMRRGRGLPQRGFQETFLRLLMQITISVYLILCVSPKPTFECC